MTQPNIALIGRMGTGKSTIAEALRPYGYSKFSWASAVRDVAKMAYGAIDKNRIYEVTVDGQPTARTGREILQRIGTDALRDQVDQDFWIRTGLRTIHDLPEPLVNDDTRFENEAATLARSGWVIVKVQIPEEIRLHRLTQLYGDKVGDVLQHPSETQVEEIPYHYGLWNTTEPALVAKTLLAQLANVVEAGAYHRS